MHTPLAELPADRVPRTEGALLDAIQAELAHAVPDVADDGRLPTQEYAAAGYERGIHAIAAITHLAFRYAAFQLHASGYQASCAAEEVSRHLLRFDGPVFFLEAANLLVPEKAEQMLSVVQAQIEAWRASWVPDAARARLDSLRHAHDVPPDVIHHLETLARHTTSA